MQKRNDNVLDMKKMLPERGGYCQNKLSTYLKNYFVQLVCPNEIIITKCLMLGIKTVIILENELLCEQ